MNVRATFRGDGPAGSLTGCDTAAEETELQLAGLCACALKIADNPPGGFSFLQQIFGIS